MLEYCHCNGGGDEVTKMTGRTDWTDQFFYLGAAPFAKYQGNVTYFTHGNHLGSTTMVYNHTGGTVVQDEIFYRLGERWDYRGYQGNIYDERFASKVAQNSAYSNSAVLPITKAAVRRLTDCATCYDSKQRRVPGGSGPLDLSCGRCDSGGRFFGRRRVVRRKMVEGLKELCASAEKHTPEVERKLAQSGTKAEAAVVHSVAKYYETLEKLAKE